ncbi:MAG: TetR/AcrR family transcriptional regulator [Ruminococcaceae bacterium]|nr:TetR/AcrR family transcriptional regulator [Oscillospiraceae bacterium]
MGRNLEKDAVEMAAKNQRILENGFRIFAENTIERVTMNDVADGARIAISSLYRYYSTKPKLVMAVATWAWSQYAEENAEREAALEKPGRTAAEMLDFYLESFLDLYRHHADLLRFNQFFNAYLSSGAVSEEEKKPYLDMIRGLEARFAGIYRAAERDGTIKTDMPEEKAFSATLHLMLAVVSRYAVGLAYNEETDVEEELRLQKEMLMQRFVKQ